MTEHTTNGSGSTCDVGTRASHWLIRRWLFALAAVVAASLTLAPAASGQMTEWAVSGGGTLPDEGFGVAVDAAGNSYVAGRYVGTATFGSIPLTSAGQSDVFVAKLDPDGNYLWAVSGGGTSIEEGRGVAVDAAGNSYVTGRYGGTATFGSIPLTSAGQSDVFVAKLDPDGNYLWAVSGGGTSIEEGRGVAVDAAGNSYVTGRYGGTATFGSIPLTSAGQSDVFVAKLDPDGNYLWAVSGGGTSIEEGRGVAVDAAGNSYVTGRYGGTATFGSIPLTSAGQIDVFVVKLDPDGNYLWAVRGGGTLPDEGFGVAVDAAGNSYVTGRYTGTATFGSIPLTSAGQSDVFVAKLDPGGNYLWAVRGGGTLPDEGFGVAVDAAGNSYVTGRYTGTATFGSIPLTSAGQSDVFVAKLDPGGNYLWAVRGGGTLPDEGFGVAVDAAGNSYVTGRYMGTATFGSIPSLTSAGSGDVFVWKLDGPPICDAVQGGGMDVDAGNAIVVDAAGNSYVTGSFTGPASFGSFSASSVGDSDFFVAKVDANGNYLWVSSGGSLGETFAGLGIGIDASGNSYVTGSVTQPGNGLDVFWVKLDSFGAVQAGFIFAGPQDDMGLGIAVDAAGNSVITGSFSGMLTFGSTTLTSAGATDVFIVKLDATGSVQWATTGSGPGGDVGHCVGLDGAGNSYVAGRFANMVTFGGLPALASGGGSDRDIFVTKLNSAGVYQWAVRAGGTGDDRGLGIAVETGGDSFVTGRFANTATFGALPALVSSGGDDVFVTKVGSAAGAFLWAVRAGGPSTDRGRGIALDAAGNSYVTGQFAGTAGFGGTTLMSAGADDVFLTKLGPTGAFQWAKRAGGPLNDVGNGVAVQAGGDSFVTGFFEGTADFCSTTLMSAGSSDAFVMLCNPNLPPSCVPGGPYTVSCGGSIVLDGTASSDADGDTISYMWSTDCPGATLTNEMTATPTLMIDRAMCCDATCTVTLTLNDGNKGVSTCRATVTIEDNQDPVAVCQGITVFLDVNGNASLTASQLDGGSTDNCPDPLSFSASRTTFTCMDKGTVPVTLTVTDAAGNIDTCTAMVMVVDEIDPVARCKDITVTLDGSGMASIVPADVNDGSSDNCPGFVLTSVTPNTFGCQDKLSGPVTVTLLVTDASGNMHTCTADVTVVDEIDPVARCKNITVMLDGSGMASIVPADVNDNSSDNCRGLVLTSVTPNMFNCAEKFSGPVTVTLLVTDASGNQDSCTADVTVVDEIDPVARCKNITVMLDESGMASIVPADVNDNSSDNCRGLVLTSVTPNMFNCAEKFSGPVTVTLLVTDASGNQDSCTADVTVVDEIDPVARCKNITVMLDGSGVASILPADVNDNSSDNCPGLVLTSVTPNMFNCAEKLSGPVTVTLLVTDASGNEDTCTAEVTVVDEIDPVARCKNITVMLDGSGMASIVPADVNDNSSDNCRGLVLTSVTPNMFNCAEKLSGPVTVTLLVTDASGNEDTCTAEVTVVDEIDPVARCKNITVELDGSGMASIVPADVDDGSSDNCPGLVLTSVTPSTFSCPDKLSGPVTVTLLVTDASGNTDTCTALVTVDDNIHPTPLDGAVPPDRTAPCELIPEAPETLPGNDNCDPAILFFYDQTGTLGDITPGPCENEFTILRTWTAIDPSGNSTTVGHTIVVVDNTAPVMAGVGPDLALSCPIKIPTERVTATDNCADAASIAIAMTETDNKGSGCLGDPLVITRMWTATDPCGNVSTASRTITVEDTEVPVLSGVPASLTLECGPVPDAADVTASDNCPGVVVALFENTTRGDCPQTFTVTRTWVATDACGLSTTAVQVITIRDTTPPTVDAAPSSVTVECDAIPAPLQTLGAADDCDGTVSEATLNAPQIKAGPCPDTFVMIRSWTATDGCGNATTVSQTIHVQDTTPPVVSAPPDVTVECGDVPDVPKSIDATDNCGEVTVTYNGQQNKEGRCAGALILIRSWTAVDECGNEETVSQTITLVDTTPPGVAKPPADETLECSTALPLPPKSLSAFDHCDDDVQAATLNKPVIIAGACPQEYTMILSWTATDGCGNSTTVSQTLTVVDTTPPAPLKGAVPPNRVSDCQLIPDAPRSIAAADACDESVTEFTYDGEESKPGPCPQEYTLVRTWSGQDACGNVGTATQTITVVDTTPPTFVGSIGDLAISCPGDVPAIADVTAIDNCAPAEDIDLVSSESSNKGAGCPGDPLVITRTYTASDPCGNDITLVQTITVVDDEAPVLTGVPKSGSVECGAIPDAADVAASDNCPGVVLVFDEVTEPGPCDATVTVTRTWTATDACGNVTEATQVITSVDDTPPTIEGVSGDVTVSCSGDVPRLDEVTATDDCADPDAITIDMSEATNKGAGCPDDPLVLTRSYTATDPCGNVATATQTVTVIDDEAPSLVGVPASTRVSCDAVPTPADVTATDNCPGASVAYSETLTPGVCEDTYTLTRVWIATDACGNETSASQEITVSDLTAPVVTGCDEGLSVHADAGTCEAEVTWAAPNVTDNCDPAPSVTYDIDLDDDGGVDVTGHASTTFTFPGGTHRVTAVATDRCGNADDSCTFLVEVTAFNEVLLDIAFAGTMASPLTRCITFEFWSCGGETVEVVEQSILFIAGLAEGVSVLVPCGEYDCLTARDTLHTLARTDDDFAAAGPIYVADFADDDELVGGNANDDETIDILDFGTFVSLFGQPGGGGGCPAEGPDADFNGDGTVNTPDYTFIANNFFDFADPGCCPGAAAAEASDPLIAISVANLWKRGLGHLTPADLNRDGWLDAQDVALFGQGARPDHRVATLRPDVQTAWWTDASTWSLKLTPDATTVVVLERGAVTLREDTQVRRVEVEAGAWLTISDEAWLTSESLLVRAGAVLEVTGRGRLSATSIEVEPGGLLIADDEQIDSEGFVMPGAQ